MALSLPSLLTESGTNTDATSYSSASVRPTAGALVLAMIMSGKSGNVAETPVSVTKRGAAGMTLVAESPVPNNNARVSLWKMIATDELSPYDMVYSTAMGNTAWHFFQFTADNGTPEVVQAAINSTASAGSEGATLAASPDNASCVIGGLAYNSGSTNTPTVGAGFTQLGSRFAQASPTAQLMSQYDASNPPALAPFGAPNGAGRGFITAEIAEPTLPGGSTPKLWTGSAEVSVTVTLWTGSSEVPVTLT